MVLLQTFEILALPLQKVFNPFYFMNLKPFATVLLLGAMFFSPACKKKDSPPDPCAEMKIPTNDNLIIEEKLLYNKFKTDTVMTSNAILFSVSEKYNSYEWKISGSDQRWTTPTFSLIFLENIGNYQVTLIGKRAPKTACFPTDDGIDTLKRTFRVTAHELSPIIGEYEGTHEGETDKFTVSIAYNTVVSQDGSSTFQGYHIKNINKGCIQGGSLYPNTGLRMYHGGNAFEMDHRDIEDVAYNCFSPLAKGYLLNRNQLVVEYTYADMTKPFTVNGRPRIAKKFIGYRK